MATELHADERAGGSSCDGKLLIATAVSKIATAWHRNRQEALIEISSYTSAFHSVFIDNTRPRATRSALNEDIASSDDEWRDRNKLYDFSKNYRVQV